MLPHFGLGHRGRNPGLSTDVVVQVLDLGLDSRHNLDGTGAGADHRHREAADVSFGVPCRTVDELSFKVKQSRNVRPFPIIQGADTAVENVAGIVDQAPSRTVLNLNMPLCLGVIETSFNDFVVPFHIFPDPIFCDNILPILQNFFA